MGPDSHLKYIVTAMVVFQIISTYYIIKLPWPWILLLAYCLGGTINHSLTLAIHDISHNVAFGNSWPLANRYFSMFANLPIGIPYSIGFKKYHVDHHRYLATDYYDVDLPTSWEGHFFNNRLLKVLWVILLPLFYVIRPLFVHPLPLSRLEIINMAMQFVFDIIMVYFCGFMSLVYMTGGTLLAMGLHPLAGHFISEHYMYDKGFETYSYYGILNKISFNVGYHIEHHDFPYIPGSRLPEVKRIASEFYDPLPQYTSWCKVLWDFIMDPNKGPFARVKRDFDETQFHGKKVHNNPYYKVLTAAVKPSEIKQMYGYREEGCEKDWNSVPEDAVVLPD